MRPHGRATIDPRDPRATAICQRCGAFLNHDQLRWQYEWGGLRLINLRLLVCDTCEDEPQVQLRTIILPPDPVPIEFPVPENYPNADNPVSPIGYSPIAQVTPYSQTAGANIGNLTGRGGLNAAFDGITKKVAEWSAAISVSQSSFQNFIGKNWNAPISGALVPSTLVTTITYNVTSFTVYAPSDNTIGTLANTVSGSVFSSGVFDANVFDTVATQSAALGLQLQGTNDGVTWTVLYSTTLTGAVGEVVTSLSSNLTTGNYQQHRIAIEGDGAPIRVAQVQFNVADTGNNEQ